MSLPLPRPVSAPPPARPARAGLLKSFRHAYEGLIVACGQRNMKVHVVSAVLVCLVGSGIRLGLAEKVSLIFCVMLVFFAEILNTALEAIIDLFVKDFHRLAMLAKDAAAGGVLVFAVTTVFVLAEILWMQWHVVMQNIDAVVRSCAFGIPVVLLEAAGLFVVRRTAVQVARAAASLALLAPLVLHTRDPFFAALAVVLVVMAFVARAFYVPRHEGP